MPVFLQRTFTKFGAAGVCIPAGFVVQYFLIWTTTIWTLPGNMAIAVHPRESYVLVKADNGEQYILAEALTEKVMKAGGIEHYEIAARFTGSDFEYMKARHPFLDKDSLLCCCLLYTSRCV